MSVATVELDKREREILRGSVQSLAKNLANNLRAARFTEHWTEAAEFEQQIRELVEV
jgi:hypothetical protein